MTISPRLKTLPGAVQGGKKGFYRLPAQRGGADILERDFKNNNLMNKSIEYERNI